MTRFAPELVIWLSLIWSCLRTCWVLVENKSIHRNRAEKNAAERNLTKKQERENKEQTGEGGCWRNVVHFGKDQVAILWLKFKYLVIPLVKALPSIIFRVLCFWLLLSYCSEFYPDDSGNGPGLGLWFPFVMMTIVSAINFGVGYKLGLKFEENRTNCVTNLVIPVYVDLFYLVSIFNFRTKLSLWVHLKVLLPYLKTRLQSSLFVLSTGRRKVQEETNS